MREIDPRLVMEPEYGFLRIDPVPSAAELDRFYESGYADLMRQGGRAPDVARLAAGGPEADAERAWLKATLFSDILNSTAERLGSGVPRRALDVGAGTGEFVASLVEDGWEAVGLEPARPIAKVAAELGRPIRAATLQEYIDGEGRDARFGLVSALNVLEHLPDPVSFCDQMRGLLEPGGLLVIRVPNEFNPLQRSAQRLLGREPWWIVIPDHISYFDSVSIQRLLTGRGFDVVDLMADFPMELFLLMGDNYLDDAELGRQCHERRRRAEMAMDTSARRSLGRSLAGAGIGRNVVAIGQRR